MAGYYLSLRWYLLCIHSQACLLPCLISSGLVSSFYLLFFHFYNTAMAVFFLCFPYVDRACVFFNYFLYSECYIS